MILKMLDRFEEALISFLMSAAVFIIFVAVCQRYSIGILADLVNFSRKNDYPTLMQFTRGIYGWLSSVNLLWAQELCIYLFVWMAKFGAAYGVRQGIHVGVDILVQHVRPSFKKALTVCALLAGVLFTAIVAWIGGSFTWNIAQTGSVSPDLEIPVWIVYLAVPAGSALMCFRFLQVMVNFLRTGELPNHDHSVIETEETPKGNTPPSPALVSNSIKA